MNPSGDERIIEKLVDHAQRGLAIMSDEQLDAGWERLRDSAASRKEPRRTRPRWRLPAFALAGAVAVALVAVAGHRLVLDRQGDPLRYSIEGSAAAGAGLVTGAPSTGTRVLFSDQSRIELSALARLTVDAVNARGAQVTLLDGSIHVYVEPRPHAGWTFAAGPFRVKVKGTAFRLAYAAGLGRMTLQMTSGWVEVQGSRGRTISVAAGESIELYAEPTVAASGPVQTAPPPSEEAAPEAPSAAELPLPAAAQPPLPSRTSGPAEALHRRPVARAKEEREAPAEPAPVPWSRLIGQGKFADVVAEAERRGIDATLVGASAADLSSLADAARYTKRHDLARRALLAVRARFAGTEPARDASFFLGRLGEALPGQSQAALGWYETYLREAPRGLYASEALGREMTLLVPTARDRAGKLAKQYLERFPHGSQAELARSLLETGSE